MDASVQDVDWGEAGSNADTEEDSELGAPGADNTGVDHGHSSIGDTDALAHAAKGEDHGSFAEWVSKGEEDGDEFAASAEGEDMRHSIADGADEEAGAEAVETEAAETEVVEAAEGVEGEEPTQEAEAGKDAEAEKEDAEGAEEEEDAEGAAEDGDEEEGIFNSEGYELDEDGEIKLDENGEKINKYELDEDGHVKFDDNGEKIKRKKPAQPEDADQIVAAEDTPAEIVPVDAEGTPEVDTPKSQRGGVLRRKVSVVSGKIERVFSGWQERHINRVRCVLIPLFCCLTPCIILLIILLAIRRLFRRIFRTQEKEDEELEAALAEEEKMRKEAARASGPQRSTLKRPNQFQRFGRQRQLANDVEKGPQDQHEHHDGHSPRGLARLTRDQRKELRSATQATVVERESKWSKKRTKAKGGIGMEGDDDMEAEAKVLRDSLLQLLNPLRWPGYFLGWWKYRKLYFQRVRVLLDTIEEEEEFDWDTLDEDGNPTKNTFLFPTAFRRKYRFFILVYWDPILDLVDQWPLLLKAIRMLIRLTPLFALIGALSWFGISLWKNLQYVEGNCIVEKLPTEFETTGMIDEMVKARYIVRRFFAAKPTRHAGSVVQDCISSVPCTKMDYGDTNSYDDDRCVLFQSWKIGDEITCYFAQDDYWGDKGSDLACLSLPSKMERETFTVAIAAVINVLICVILGVYKWNASDLKRQADLAAAEQAAAEAEEAAAKRMIEEQEAQEVLRQQEAVNRELGIAEGDEEAADFLAVDMEMREEGQEGIEAERTAQRAAMH